jgi:hypothetical protein
MTFVAKVLDANKNWVRSDQKCILVFVKSIRYSYQILMTLEISGQIFEKYSNIEFQ